MDNKALLHRPQNRFHHFTQHIFGIVLNNMVAVVSSHRSSVGASDKVNKQRMRKRDETASYSCTNSIKKQTLNCLILFPFKKRNTNTFMRPVLVLFLFLAVAGPSEHDCDLTRNNINIEKQHWKITLLKLQT